MECLVLMLVQTYRMLEQLNPLSPHGTVFTTSPSFRIYDYEVPRSRSSHAITSSHFNSLVLQRTHHHKSNPRPARLRICDYEAPRSRNARAIASSHFNSLVLQRSERGQGSKDPTHPPAPRIQKDPRIQGSRSKGPGARIQEQGSRIHKAEQKSPTAKLRNRALDRACRVKGRSRLSQFTTIGVVSAP